MGAKTWMLVYSKGNPKDILKSHPALDREATTALVGKLFSAERLQALDDGDLSFTCPPEDEIAAACYPGLVILAADEFGIDFPSRLSGKFVDAFSDGTLYLHAMHSVVDWFAFAVWRNGELRRSLSLSPDSGILEDIGDRLPFEAPYWAGERPVFGEDEFDDEDEEEDGYPFVFHPLELGEAALDEFFGYILEGVVEPGHLEPEQIPLMRFKRSGA